MSDDTHQLGAAAARAYEKDFVPALFAEWAPRLCDRLRIEPEMRALDVACGTGVVAREMARRGARTVGSDRNAGMLAVARELDPSVRWEQARAEALPFDDASFDVVACQFGAMFFDDRHAAIREMRRVLAPRGRMIVAVWDVVDAWEEVIALLERLFGAEVADVLRAPFTMHGDALELLHREGGIDARIERVVGEARFASIRDWVETNVRAWALADHLDEPQIATLLAEAEVALAPYASEEGVRFDSPAILATS